VIYSQQGHGDTAAAASQDTSVAPVPPAPTMVLTKIDVDRNDPVQQRILADYGAVFVTQNGAVPPPKVIFTSADEVTSWQSSVPTRRERLGRYEVELQAPAMAALLAARDEARSRGLDVTARAADSARRDYAETVRLWLSRVEPALKHWVGLKRLASDERERIRRLSPRDQVPEVLALEERGLWCNTDFTKSILYSVAAPGTSQHLSMLALDVGEFENATVRQILARHGWFQTVRTDLPHFTYLGVDEPQLPSLGLRRVVADGRPFWIPDLERD